MNKFTTTLATAILTVGVSNVTNAVPNLQIDGEAGSTYDDTTETTVCSDSTCDFYAIASPGQASGEGTDNPNGPISENDILTQTFYVSIAVSPMQTETNPGPDLGSFDLTYNGANGMTPTTTTINVTADMVFGTPPIETFEELQSNDNNLEQGGDLPTHGVFETYFTEIAIMFVATRTIDTYNVVDDTPENNLPGTGSFYEKLTIDRTDLDEGIQLHLDLYNTVIAECGKQAAELIGTECEDIDAGRFAPFSHDAETGSTSSSGQSTTTSSGQSTTTSSGQSSTGTGVPEPSTLALLGFGILSGLLFSRRRKVSA